MKRELAEHYFQYGVIMTALGLYKELHLLEDCVNCLEILNKKEEAIEMVGVVRWDEK